MFWGYAIYLFLYKYKQNPNKVLLQAAIVVQVSYVLFNQFLLMYYGEAFVHHILLSSFVMILYLYLVIFLDSELMLLCEKIGFVKKSSRKWKFYNFVFYLTL